MREIREAVKAGTFSRYAGDFAKTWSPGDVNE
jgi:hypothetical protein